MISRSFAILILRGLTRNHAEERTPFPSTRDGLGDTPLLFPWWDARKRLNVPFSTESDQIYPLLSRAKV
jgi:hypothetical protein